MDPFLAAFLLIPLLALIAKELGKLKLPLGLIFLILVPAGWLLLSLRVQWYFVSLDALVRKNPNPSPDLLSKMQNTGGAMMYALYLGWAMSAIYFVLCLGLIKIVSFFLRRQHAGS
jgi:hypothetical protein